MTPAPTNSGPPPSIHDVAAQWVLRRDRGLTATEQDELSQWLAADPHHGEALALHRWGWDELDRLTGLQTSLSAVADPDLLAPRPGSSRRLLTARCTWLAASLLVAAAAVAVTFDWHAKRAMPASATPLATAPVSTVLAAPCERRVLADGSVVDLNRGAAVAVDYSPESRRVRMERGEASFSVAKNPERPFIVSAGNYEVRAVGTAFNVRLTPTGIEVLVTEGKVRVTRNDDVGEPAALAAGDYTMLPHQAGTVHVSTLSVAQVSAQLAWQPRLLDFTDAPLREIVACFNAHNPVQLSVDDPALATLPLSATFRSDNVEGFVKLMESAFGMQAEWRNERQIALVRAR